MYDMKMREEYCYVKMFFMFKFLFLFEFLYDLFLRFEKVKIGKYLS